MENSSRLSRIALATSAAALFATGALSGCTTSGDTTATASAAEGHCMGVNACKGTSDCKTASNACAGQNACKGQGFVALDADTCEQVGGKFEGA